MGQLTRADINLLNAYENVTGKPKTVIRPKYTVTKSELDTELENYKIAKLNDLFSTVYEQITENSQDIASKWAVALNALETLKNEVDLNSFLTYTYFNQLYNDSLEKLEAYKKQIEEIINFIDEFCLSMKAIVPDESLRII